MTVKQLVRNLGDQFNMPVSHVASLDLDAFVDSAIKVEEGELETLRVSSIASQYMQMPILQPPPIEPTDVRLDSAMTFADEDEG